jgi:hypothetical protein
LEIIDPLTGLSLTPTEIFHNLKKLVESTEQKGIGLGIMTAAHRDSWFEVYTELSKSLHFNFVLYFY